MRFNIRPQKRLDPYNGNRKIKIGRSAPSRNPVGRPGHRTFTPQQDDLAARLRAEGRTKQETADLTGLTLQQVHYLWYIRPRQQALSAEARSSVDLTPLDKLVPNPVRRGHNDTLPDHKYKGRPTALRTDLIEQIIRCKGQGHPPQAVAEHFNLTPSTVKYVWYQLSKINNKEG